MLTEEKTEINAIIDAKDVSDETSRLKAQNASSGSNVRNVDGNYQTQPPTTRLKSEDLEVPQLITSTETEDPYAGKDIFLVFEGNQEVFYRGDYVTRILLTGEPLLIGRRDVMAGHYPDIDLAMYWKQDRSISRRHMRIYHDASGAWFAEDICNNNATFINDFSHPINRERIALKNGDRILISNSIAIKFSVFN